MKSDNVNKPIQTLFAISIIISPLVIWLNLSDIYGFIIGNEYKRFITNYDEIDKVYICIESEGKFRQVGELIDQEKETIINLLVETKEEGYFERGSRLDIDMIFQIVYKSNNKNLVLIKVRKKNGAAKFYYQFGWTRNKFYFFSPMKNFTGNQKEELDKLFMKIFKEGEYLY